MKLSFKSLKAAFVAYCVFLLMVVGLCITVAMCSKPVTPISLVQLAQRGYSTGKECFQGLGCGVRTSFWDCVKCCLQCPIQHQDACVQLCEDAFPNDKIRTVLEARTMLASSDPVEIGEGVAMLKLKTLSKDPLVQHLALRAAKERPEGMFK